MCVPGQELALLVRIPVNRVVEKVGPNPAIIEQGVPLARSTVARDVLAFPPSGDQELQEPSLGLLDLLAEGRVRLESLHSGGTFRGLDRLDGRDVTGLVGSSACRP